MKSPIRPVIAQLKPSGISQVTALGLGNPDVLPLWFGETDLVTPPFIRKAAAQALEDGRTFYTNARGITPLREAISAFHKRTIGADIPIERITIPGAAMLAAVTALQMVCETGDNIVVVSPIWPNIFQAAKVVGAEPRLVRLEEDWNAGRWRLDMDKLFDACDERTKALFLASPGNPTGWMLTADEQKIILDFCRQRGIAILADEVYGVPRQPAGTLPRRARCGGKVDRAAEPRALDETGRRLLRLPACRRPERQSGLLPAHRAGRSCRRVAGLGLQPGRSARRLLPAHLLRAGCRKAGTGADPPRRRNPQALNRFDGGDAGQRRDAVAQGGVYRNALFQLDLDFLARIARHHDVHQALAGLRQLRRQRGQR